MFLLEPKHSKAGDVLDLGFLLVKLHTGGKLYKKVKKNLLMHLDQQSFASFHEDCCIEYFENRRTTKYKLSQLRSKLREICRGQNISEEAFELIKL